MSWRSPHAVKWFGSFRCAKPMQGRLDAMKRDKITKAERAAVASPPLTRKQLSAMRPVEEVLPQIVAASRRGRPLKADKKRLVSIRYDADVLRHFQRRGAGWQVRMNAALRKATKLDDKKSGQR